MLYNISWSMLMVDTETDTKFKMFRFVLVSKLQRFSNVTCFYHLSSYRIVYVFSIQEQV